VALIAAVAVNRVNAKYKAVRLGIFSLNDLGGGENRAVITECKRRVLRIDYCGTREALYVR
jgi:hypothetical protein